MLDVENAVPTFFVADVRKSAEWYHRVLGFRPVFLAEGYAGLELGPARIHLAQIEVSKPGEVYKGACYLRLHSGLDEYAAAIEASGERLVAAVKDHGYGMREATVRDLDGNDIYIGQPIR